MGEGWRGTKWQRRRGALILMNFPIIFFLISVVALIFVKGPVNKRVEIYSKGAGQPDLLLMVWIFLLAGAFASTAKAMGAIDAAVGLTLSVMPASMLLPGLFLAVCLISFSIGTSVGTIAALTPIAVGMADATGISVPLVVGCIVGGSFFGDNLSFISDTTIVATRTQGIALREKFLANFRIVLPAALIALALYVWIGIKVPTNLFGGELHPGDLTALNPSPLGGVGGGRLLLVLPYLAVIVLALLGVNVMVVLLAGNFLAGLIGIATGALVAGSWGDAVSEGMAGMQETILVALMAGGLLAVVRHTGFLDYLIRQLTRRVSGQRGAEWSIAALVSLTNVLTANNTVAILSVGGISADIARRFGVDPRRSASILDTFSCIVQGFLPYGAQLLVASGLAGISAVSIIPSLYYTMLLLLVACIAIIRK